MQDMPLRITLNNQTLSQTKKVSTDPRIAIMGWNQRRLSISQIKTVDNGAFMWVILGVNLLKMTVKRDMDAVFPVRQQRKKSSQRCGDKYHGPIPERQVPLRTIRVELR